MPQSTRSDRSRSPGSDGPIPSDIGPIASRWCPDSSEIRIFRWSSGDVGEGVEEGEGVGAEFCAVTAQAMREVGGEGMEAFFS